MDDTSMNYWYGGNMHRSGWTRQDTEIAETVINGIKNLLENGNKN